MGDAQRGMQAGPASYAVGSFKPIMEHPNRGKRSIGLALHEPARARRVPRPRARRCDVFVTNFLPDARRGSRSTSTTCVRSTRASSTCAGSAFGAKGPDAGKGGFDSSAFWSRGGGGAGITPPEVDGVLGMPAPAYGDSMGGMTIAGGIAAALFARERTGEGCVVDVSLLALGGLGRRAGRRHRAALG